MHEVVPLPHVYLHGLMLNCYAKGKIGFYHTFRRILCVLYSVYCPVNYFIVNDVICILKFM